MSATSRSNLILGLICIVFATALTFIWIPFDTESGIVEKVRGRFNIGDALAPTVAACFILFGGILLLVSERSAPDQPALGKSHITFIASLMAVAVTGLLVMRFAGPVLANPMCFQPGVARSRRYSMGSARKRLASSWCRGRSPS